MKKISQGPPPPKKQGPPSRPPTTSTPSQFTPNNAVLQTILDFLNKCPGFLSQIEPDANRSNALKNALNGLASCLSQNQMNPQDMNGLNQVVSNIYSNNLADADSCVKALLQR
jgi:hypothetical protein